MKVSDILHVHQNLWAGRTGRTADAPTKEFRSQFKFGHNFVTQNMRKPSPNTRWIKEDPEHRRITWLFKNGEYVGRVREFKEDDKTVTEVHHLSPEYLVYRKEDDEDK
jgi:hypothetical protein